MKKLLLALLFIAACVKLCYGDLTLTAGEGIDIVKSGVGGTVTVSGEDASTTNKGIASFSTSHFSVSSGAVSLVDSYIRGLLSAGTGMSYNNLTGVFTCSITQYTDALARATISSSATGITYTSASGIISLTTGYGIPSTTQITNWDTAYGWGNHASAGYITANQTITLSGDASGSGTTAITVVVADNSHAHTTTTVSGLDISDDTNLAGTTNEITLTGDTLSLASAITRDTEWDTAAEINAATTDADFLTAEVDGSTTNELPTAGTGIDVSGTEVAFDSTEIGTTTWGSGSGITWTFNASATTDPGITFGNNTVTSTNNFTVGNTFTVGDANGSNQVTFANPGIGNYSRFYFTKTNDQAWIDVTENTSDSTTYGFYMADNPDSTSDKFLWQIQYWGGDGADWTPLYFSGYDARIAADDFTMYGGLSINGPAYFGGGTPSTVSSLSVSGTLAFTPGVSSFSNSSPVSYCVVIDGTGSPNTFKWGTGSCSVGYETWIAETVSITGSAQTLNNGVTITWSGTTGGVLNDRFHFLVMPGGDLVVSDDCTVTGDIIKNATTWNSGDNIDGTKVANADLGDIGVSSGVWDIEEALLGVGGADTIFPADPNADRYLMWDDDPGALVWSAAAAGYTNLTEFVAQTAWRVFYSNTAGDVTELALGASGTYLMSNGATSAPTFETPAGSGDVTGVGDCTGGACLDGTSDGGTNIALYDGDSNKTTVQASNTAIDPVITLPATTGTLIHTEVDPTVDSSAEIQAIIGANIYQAYDADLTTYAGITPHANAQTLLAETFAQMQASLSIDDLITLSGVAEGSVNLATFTGATIADNVTIKAALQALETAVEGKEAADANIIKAAEIDTLAELETIMSAINILAETEIDASAELLALMDDETGSASGSPLLVFNVNPTLTGATLAGILADNDDMVFEADANSDGSNKYSFTDGASAEIASITEAGLLTVADDIVITGSDLTVGAAGVKLTGDGDGAITLLGLGNGFDEDLNINLDDVENIIDFTSSTGVTDIDFNTLDLNTDTLDLTGTGTINGLDAIDATGETTLEAALDIAGEVTSTGMSTTVIADSVAVTSWNLTTPTITTSLTTSTPTTLSAAELDRLDGLTSAIIDDDKIDTFAELDAIVADKALVNKADGAVWLGTHDFGGAVLEIPNGATVTDPTAAGQVAIDTTTGQLLYHDGTAQRVITYNNRKCFGWFDPADADDDIETWIFKDAATVTNVSCRVSGGTSLAVVGGDGTNSFESITCDADGATDDGSITNATFTAGEVFELDCGAPSGTVPSFTYCVDFTTTAD